MPSGPPSWLERFVRLRQVFSRRNTEDLDAASSLESIILLPRSIKCRYIHLPHIIDFSSRWMNLVRVAEIGVTNGGEEEMNVPLGKVIHQQD